MAVNLSDPEVEFITRQFYDQPPTKDWVILTYSPQRDKLVLYAAGSEDASEFERSLDAVGEEVAYGLFRDVTGRVLFVTWVGEGVGGVKRARATVHGRLVGTKLFSPHDLAITINTTPELHQHLTSSSETPRQNQTPTPPQHTNGANGSNGTNGTNGFDQQARLASSSTSPQASDVSHERKTRPDLPHLTTLGPVRDLASSDPHSRAASQEPPLPSPLKELPAPPFATVSSQEPGPSHYREDRGNEVAPSAPASYPVDRHASPPTSQAQQRSPLSPEHDSSSRPTSSNNPITRLSNMNSSPPASPTGSNFSGRSNSSSMGRPSIPLFSSLSILGRGKGKGRSVSAGSGPPPVPPKDSPRTPTSAASPTSFSHFPIGTSTKPIVEEEPPVSIVRGLDSFGGSPPRAPPAHLPQPTHQPHPTSPPTSRRPPLPAAIIVKSPTVTSIDPEDAYDAYDPGSPHSPPRPSPPPASAPTAPRTLPTPPTPLTPQTGASAQPTTAPLDLTRPRYPTHIANHQTQNWPTHRSVSTPTSAQHQRSPSSPESDGAPPNHLSHFRRGSRGSSETSSVGWLQEQQTRRLEEDREQIALAAASSTKLSEDELVARARAREEEEEAKRVEKEREREERLRHARERSAEIEREEARKKEEAEERKRKEAEERERKEREEGERKAEVVQELWRARMDGRRLADGWVTVQAPNSVLFRRRYFHILPSMLLLHKSPEETATPMTTIPLPVPATGQRMEVSDAYEEIQVLHSFRVEDRDGKMYLFYCDSEADKEVVVEALKIAASL